MNEDEASKLEEVTGTAAYAFYSACIKSSIKKLSEDKFMQDDIAGFYKAKSKSIKAQHFIFFVDFSCLVIVNKHQFEVLAPQDTMGLIIDLHPFNQTMDKCAVIKKDLH